ncbi:hypothetical protein [Kribbella sp. NPDC055071]
MNDLVPRDSPTYGEFARLHRLARSLRPTGPDRWNGDLYTSSAENAWGGFDPRTGAIQLSDTTVLPYLTRETIPQASAAQSQALASVLHASTRASIAMDDPAARNAVRSDHSLSLHAGIAELRTRDDFKLFTRQAGYRELQLPPERYEGAYKAAASLVEQASGVRRDRVSLVNELNQGPVSAHFDRLAHGVVQNRLWDVVPHHQDHQQAALAAIQQPMIHEAWPWLVEQPSEVGQRVGDEIRSGVNAKVDQIRRHYQRDARTPFESEGAEREVRPDGNQRPAPSTAQENPGTRFLGAQPSAAGAVESPPVLGDGSRRRDAGAGRAPGKTAHTTHPANRPRGV